MKQKLKFLLMAIFEEFHDVFNLLYYNITRLIKLFWRQSWKKKGIDILTALVLCCLIPIIGTISFNLSMFDSSDKLNTFQFIIYSFILASFSAFIFFNFIELFIVLSLGGIAIFNQSLYESINKRILVYKAQVNNA